MQTQTKRLTSVTACLIAAAFALASCGSNDSSTSAPPATTTNAAPDTTTTAPAGDDYTAVAAAAVEAAYLGLSTDPPTGGPGVPNGQVKDIIIIPCGTEIAGCNNSAQAAADGAKALGWNVKIVTGGLSPANYNAAINQAVVAGADAIITVGIDCPNAIDGLTAAKKAGVVVVGTFSFDCDDPKVNAGPSLYSATMNPDPVLWGRLRAQTAIAATGGKARVIQVIQPEFTYTQYADKAFSDEMAKCSGCTIVGTLDITGADLGDAAITGQKIATALQQYPDANVLQTSTDSVLLQAAQAIRADGRADLFVIGGEGFPEVLDLVREGVADVAIGMPTKWFGWAAMDIVWRKLGGATDLPDEGASYQIINLTHGLPGTPATPWVPSIDFEALYTKNWLNFK